MLQQMLDRYVCRNEAEYVNAIREIMQELALLGLWRSKFSNTPLSMAVRLCELSMDSIVVQKTLISPC